MDKRFISVIFIAMVIAAAVFLDGGFRFSNHKKSISEAGSVNSTTELKTKNLSSFFTNKSDYDSAFLRASNVEKKDVLAGIVPHHYLAKDMIARFFSGIDNKDIENIILIGPDHYNALDNVKVDAVTTKLSWDTPYGELDPNREMQDKILASNNIIENDSVFKGEHSIYTLIPFVKKAFPLARVIPLVIRNNNSYEKFISLGENIREIAGNKTILIVSSDFSHNATIAEAAKNDMASIATLKKLNKSDIGGISSDCKACMAVLYGFLETGQSGFYLAENKNSSDFGSRDETVTSYISGYYLRKSEANKNIKILFLGDMMFDRHIRQAIEKNGSAFIFQKIESLLQNNDLVVGNLEGPITDYRSVSVNSRMGETNNFIFTFDPAIAGLLASENISLVNLGNNHISNFGNSGIEQTRKYLAESGVDYFGDLEKRWVLKNIGGLKIAFVNYNQFIVDAEAKAIQDISEVKKSNPDLIFLYAHWGAEYAGKPGEKIINLAHKFIDSGVDLVIGSHPHVTQPKEEYKGKIIYYSLGNFIFDQYFSSNTQKGLAVKVEINPVDKKINTEDFPVKMENNGQTVQD